MTLIRRRFLAAMLMALCTLGMIGCESSSRDERLDELVIENKTDAGIRVLWTYTSSYNGVSSQVDVELDPGEVEKIGKLQASEYVKIDWNGGRVKLRLKDYHVHLAVTEEFLASQL